MSQYNFKSFFSSTFSFSKTAFLLKMALKINVRTLQLLRGKSIHLMNKFTYAHLGLCGITLQ